MRRQAAISLLSLTLLLAVHPAGTSLAGATIPSDASGTAVVFAMADMNRQRVTSSAPPSTRLADDPPLVAPLPAGVVLLGAALVGLGLLGRGRR